MDGFACLGGGFGLRAVLLRGLHGLSERRKVAQTAGFLRQLLLFARDVGDLLIEPGDAIAVASYISFKLMAAGGEVGEFGNAFIDAAAFFNARFDLVFQFRVFGVKPRQRHLGVGGLLLLARDISRKLRQPAVEFGDALLGALFLAVQRFARIGQPLQPGRGAGLGLAQRRQFGGAHRLDAGGFGLFPRTFGHLADAEIVGMGGFRDVGIGFQPAQVKQHRLGLAHFGRDLAVADRLPRLLLQSVDLSSQLPDPAFSRNSASWRRA